MKRHDPAARRADRAGVRPRPAGLGRGGHPPGHRPVRGVADPAAFLELVRDDHDPPRVLDDLVSELTVGETYFFREPDHFRFLRDTILPEIRARKGEGHVLRAWSARVRSGRGGVLDGDPSSARGGRRASRIRWRPSISREALAKASAASYADWSFRDEGVLTRPVPISTAGANGPRSSRRSDGWSRCGS